MIQNIKYSRKVENGADLDGQELLEEDEERDEDYERDKVDAAYLSEFNDLGWEG